MPPNRLPFETHAHREPLTKFETSSTANSLSRSAENISTTSSRRPASRIRRSRTATVAMSSWPSLRPTKRSRIGRARPRRTVAHSPAHRRPDRARSRENSRAPNRSTPASRSRSRAASTFRGPRAISASSRPRSCTPNPKRTSPMASRSITRCASRAASRD